jgi:hypothetical protein
MEDPWIDAKREFERLGLDPRRCPIAGASDGAIPRLVARLRLLSAPQRWRDILPGWPAEWDEDDPETWTRPQSQRGAHDYVDFPRGPIVSLSVPGTWDEPRLESFVSTAIAAMHDIYGAGFMTPAFGPDATRIADVVFRRGSTEEQLSAFMDWIDAQTHVELAGVPRGPDAPNVQHCAYHLY